MLIFAIYTLVLFHGLVVMPMIIVGPIILFFSKKNLRWLENMFIVIGGGTVLSYIFLGSCFLTDWEQALRLTVSPDFTYTGGFVGHYLGKVGINFPDIGTTLTIGFLSVLGAVAIIRRRGENGVSSVFLLNKTFKG